VQVTGRESAQPSAVPSSRLRFLPAAPPAPKSRADLLPWARPPNRFSFPAHGVIVCHTLRATRTLKELSSSRRCSRPQPSMGIARVLRGSTGEAAAPHSGSSRVSKKCSLLSLGCRFPASRIIFLTQAVPLEKSPRTSRSMRPLAWRTFLCRESHSDFCPIPPGGPPSSRMRSARPFLFSPQPVLPGTWPGQPARKMLFLSV